MDTPRIHASKQPRRPHYIAEWAELRRLSQADLARALNVDKSIVSRWYSGASPSKRHQIALADLFGEDGDDEAIFRHPSYDWLFRFFQKRNGEEIERAINMLQAAFPEKKTTSKAS